MQNVLNIVLAILAFGLLVTVHEFGHFITAKRGGIQVNEFWIGMGPTIFSKEYNGTQYCLKVLPLGGACVMEGEDQDSDNPNSFGKASIWRRMLVIVAGALMNFITGFVIVTVVLGFASSGGFASRTIDGFEDGFLYSGSDMLMENDEILKVNGYTVLTNSDIHIGLATATDDGLFDITVRRDGEKVELVDIPLTKEIDDGSRYGIQFKVEEKTFISLMKNSLFTSINFARAVWESVIMLFSGSVGVSDLSGPVGVANVMAETAQISMSSFFMLVAFISINLGVMNLLPLPALDGGRLVFLILELFRGKPVPPKYEGFVHAAGLALLLMLMIYVTGQDIIRLII